jgi:hypothetical protein
MIDVPAIPLTQHDLFDSDACANIRKKVINLRSYWRTCSQTFFTLGAASYLDAPRQHATYLDAAKDRNALLRQEFAPEYACDRPCGHWRADWISHYSARTRRSTIRRLDSILVARESCASAEMAQRSLIRAFYFRRSDQRMPHGSYPSSGPPLSGSHLNGCVHMAAISIAFVSIGHAFRSVSPTRSRVVGLRGYETTNFMKVPNGHWYALPVQ